MKRSTIKMIVAVQMVTNGEPVNGTNPVWYKRQFDSASGYNGNNARNVKPNYMKALEIIHKLCQMGNTEQCGIYFHDSYEGIRDFFGPHAAIQYCDGRENLLRGREYVYDYECEIGDEPNVLIFPEDSLSEEKPIGLYLIEYPGE